jgi:hypothetical protein
MQSTSTYRRAFSPLPFPLPRTNLSRLLFFFSSSLFPSPPFPSNLPSKRSLLARRLSCFLSNFARYSSARWRSVVIAGSSSEARDCWAVWRVWWGVNSKCWQSQFGLDSDGRNITENGGGVTEGELVRVCYSRRSSGEGSRRFQSRGSRWRSRGGRERSATRSRMRLAIGRKA